MKLARKHRRLMTPRAMGQSVVSVLAREIYKIEGHRAIEVEQGITRRETTRKEGGRVLPLAEQKGEGRKEGGKKGMKEGATYAQTSPLLPLFSSGRAEGHRGLSRW